ncbi:c-type cytochrome [Arvimicrobium flavum]|uniref:c-type cytochrome n=1 Tax=Arvimicrobium flavum TaxID=3393320 RepID=UPI00237B5ED1|nr:cytochrome c [Mesorhizobium shangrilense]
MNKGMIIAAVAVAGIATAALWIFAGPDAPQPQPAASGKNAPPQVAIPSVFSDTAKMGEKAFDAVCAACHGENAAGTEVGPPLVHRIYEPSHHGDQAFELAVANGVRAHHWKFGNMPPQPGLTKADVATIVAYVRELQRANGID